MPARYLRTRLSDAGYTYDAVLELLGAAGQSGLERNSTVAADRALSARDEPAAVLARLFILQQPQPRGAVERVLGDLDRWRGLVRADVDTARALVDIRPYSGSGGADWWLVSDLTPGLDGRTMQPRSDFVLGASPASRQLAELVTRGEVTSALDLGTGCGVQSLHLAQHARRVCATDLNPRAIALARLTFALNEVDVDLREGSLYEPVAEDRFDLIVSNPPYVMAPPARAGLTYREGNWSGDDLVRRVVVDGARLLNPGGTLQVLGNWAVTADGWQPRIHAWLAETGCAAHIVQRELLDPYEYIEIWLADAGLLGTPEYASRYREWLAYFDQLGITGVGMGWLCLRKPSAGERYDAGHRLLEEWPHAVCQPVGDALGRTLDVLGQDPPMSDLTLLATHWRCAPDVDEERISTPGAEDPRHIVLRQRSGLMRGVLADTALAAVVGACDGELSLGTIVSAVADLLDEDGRELCDRLVPQLRNLVRDGLLTAGHKQFTSRSAGVPSAAG